MGLENLKSAFSNIEDYSKRVDKTVEEISSNIQTDITTMDSIYSIQTEPQEVDYMDNQNTPGFSANQFQGNPSLFVGIEGTNWSSTTGFYTVSNITVPGPVDWLHNDHASGFDLNQVAGNDTLFVGVEDGGDFTNTSRYTVSNITVPGPVDWMGNDKATGFTLDQEYKSPTKFTGAGEHKTVPYMEWTNNSLYGDILGDTYSFDNGLPAIDATTWEIPTNFTYQNSQYGINAISNVFSETWSYTNDIPSPTTGTTTWNVGETPLTSYYDKIHTTNAISDVMFGPVDFMSGLSSHEDSTLDSNYIIKGFTKDYDPGLFGGWTGADTTGDSKLLSMWAEDQEIDGNKYANIKTSYYTGYLDTPSNTIEFPGITGEDTLPRGSDNTIRDIYPFSLNFNPSFPGGYSADNPYGDSKFSNIDTDMHSVSLTGAGDNTISFDGTVEDGYLFNWDDITLRSGIKVNSSKGSSRGGQPSKQFNILYNTDQTAKDGFKYTGDAIDGSNVNSLDKFNLSSDLWTVDPNRVGNNAALGIFKTATLLGGIVGLNEALSAGTNTEPYVISSIGNDNTHWTNQYFPKSRIEKDVERVGKFLSSQKGEEFILQQNMLGTFQQYKYLYDPGSTLLNIAAPKEGLGTPMVNFSRDTGMVGSIIDLLVPTTYSEWIDERATGGNMFGNIADEIFHLDKSEESYAKIEQKKKPLAFAAGDALNNLADYFLTQMGLGGGGTAISKDKVGGIGPSSGIDSKNNMNISMGTTSPLGSLGKGDIKTLFPIDVDELNQSISSDLDLSKNTDGMPFYFKDLRDGVVINFRAYIEGLSETISPSWNSENYIGRSEPVYTYTSAEREIQFQLKLFAQTKDELNMIYKKMNRLTSLCYPEYKPLDTPNNVNMDNGNLDLLKAQKNISNDSRIMMKAPMVKFRLGELFGAGGTTDMTGFIKSLSYSFPDESPWEIKDGYRVPKYITADIGFQVIHSEVPSLNFARLKDSDNKPTLGNTFYGVNKTLNSNNISIGSQIDDVVSEIFGG